MKVSVVIPTFRRPELLGRCLTALARQGLDGEDYEVIVVDDARDAMTRAAVEARARTFPAALRYVTIDGGHGPAAARNAGWRAARAAIVAFTDDDTVPDRDWLAAGLAGFASGAAALAGRIVVPLPDDPTDYERDTAGLASAEFVTANCFVRHPVLCAVGGFDETFTDAWREDSDLEFRLIEAGFAIRRADAATVVHPIRPAPFGVSLRQQRKSRWNALLYKKHRALYRERIQRSAPWRYYAIVGSAMAALAGVASGHPLAALFAGSLWLAATAEFCLRRLRDTSRRPLHVLEMAVTSVLVPPLSVYWRLAGAARFAVPFL
jgi:GT2 family glycosyltransferase